MRVVRQGLAAAALALSAQTHAVAQTPPLVRFYVMTSVKGGKLYIGDDVLPLNPGIDVYLRPVGPVQIFAVDANGKTVLEKRTITIHDGHDARTWSYVWVGPGLRGRGACMRLDCSQYVPAPWGGVGTITVVNNSSLPADLIGSYPVTDDWKDTQGGRGNWLRYDSNYIAAGRTVTVTLDHLNPPLGLPTTNNYSHTIAVNRAGPVAIYVKSDNFVPACPSSHWKAVFSDGPERVTLDSYSGPVMDPGSGKQTTLCQILGCPSTASTLNGVPLRNATITTSAPQGHLTWSCG
jgi:hypothetical protein